MKFMSPFGFIKFLFILIGMMIQEGWRRVKWEVKYLFKKWVCSILRYHPTKNQARLKTPEGMIYVGIMDLDWDKVEVMWHNHNYGFMVEPDTHSFVTNEKAWVSYDKIELTDKHKLGEVLWEFFEWKIGIASDFILGFFYRLVHWRDK